MATAAAAAAAVAQLAPCSSEQIDTCVHLPYKLTTAQIGFAIPIAAIPFDSPGDLDKFSKLDNLQQF